MQYDDIASENTISRSIIEHYFTISQLRHNKSNMADGRHIENRLLVIFPRFIVRLTRNFVWRSRM